MFLLKVTPAESEPFDHEIEGDTLFIGRSTHCDITIADRFLSRRHARLFAADDGWQIEDLGSRNGTFINGRKIEQPTLIRIGDVIALSASLIKVQPGPIRDLPSDVATDVPSTDRLLRSAAEVLRRSGTPPPGCRGVGRDRSRTLYEPAWHCSTTSTRPWRGPSGSMISSS